MHVCICVYLRSPRARCGDFGDLLRTISTSQKFGTGGLSSKIFVQVCTVIQVYSIFITGSVQGHEILKNH